MRLLLSTADSSELRRHAESGLIDGIVYQAAIAPTDSRGSSGDIDGLEQLAHDIALPVYVPIGAIAAADIYRIARDLRRLPNGDNITMQIPLIEDAIAPIHRLHADGVPVCVTYVFTAAQALMAAKAGASSVMVDVPYLDGQGNSAVATIATIRNALQCADAECDVIAAFPSTGASFVDCVTAGADGVCVTPSLLRTLVVHPYTDHGVDQFLSAISKRYAAQS